LEAHLQAGCADCRVALQEYLTAASLLPYALPPEAVPFELKAHLMATNRLDFAKSQEGSQARGADREDGRDDSSPRDAPLWGGLFGIPVLALVSVVLLIGAGMYAFALRSQLQTEAAQRRQIETDLQKESSRMASLERQAADQELTLASLRKELAEKLGATQDMLATRQKELTELQTRLLQREQQLAELKKGLGKRDELTAFLRSPNMEVVALTGSEQAKSAGGLLVYDPDTQKALFYAFNMPPLPADKTYQLWAIMEKPVSAGIFGTDPGNKTRIMIRGIPDLSRIKKFAVTMEPSGGRPQPTGQIYLVGQL
jgi:uncharacterized coiled-coil protein SlyX